MWNHSLRSEKFLSCFLTKLGANQASLFLINTYLPCFTLIKVKINKDNNLATQGQTQITYQF